MKCSRRKAPMGTTPLREWRRRSRKEVPSPARSGATPDWILGATGWAVDATMTTPCVVQCANWLLSVSAGREVKERREINLVEDLGAGTVDRGERRFRREIRGGVQHRKMYSSFKFSSRFLRPLRLRLLIVRGSIP